MRLTVTILCGTRAGQRFVVACGEILRFGRTAKADVVVADDPTMSALHFELEYGETAIVARDLQSRNRLFLNGEAVTEAVLVDGDQLRAGRTYFSVSIADPLSPSLVPDAADETRAPGSFDATRAVFRAPIPNTLPRTEPLPLASLFPGQLAGGADANVDTSGGFASNRSADAGHGGSADHLYAIVDGELGSPFVAQAQDANRRTALLAAVGAPAYAEAVVPYLVEMSRSDSTSTVGDDTHGRQPGILIESPADFDELLHHLRAVYCQHGTDGRFALFDFCEPHLLHQWLQNADPFQLGDFFGRISSVVLDIHGDGRLLRVRHAGDRLLQVSVDA